MHYALLTGEVNIDYIKIIRFISSLIIMKRKTSHNKENFDSKMQYTNTYWQQLIFYHFLISIQ